MDPVHVPVAGPSRPRRAPGNDLGDRIMALQRRGAAPLPSSRSRFEQVDEYTRGPPQAAMQRRLWDPSQAQPAPHMPRQAAVPPINTSQRYDSSRPAVASPTPLSPRRDRERERDRDRSRIEDHDREYDRRSAPRLEHSPRPAPSRRLFDPDETISRPSGSASSGRRDDGHSHSSRRIMELGSDRFSGRRTPRTPEEEADRERERRRRKEGSERGSLVASAMAKRRERDDGRSKRSMGSKSSEGSESFKDRERGKGRADTGVKAILKEIHDKIKAIEADLTEMHRKMSADPEAGILILLDTSAPTRDSRSIGRNSGDFTTEEASAWLDLIGKHKQLADLHHDFLTRVFDPLVPASLHQLTVRYNIPSRMWQIGYHHILERLRLSWMSGRPMALDLLTDLVYDAYKFYTDLLEDLSLTTFRTAWIEALGDLARYRMAIASHLSSEARGEGSAKARPPGKDDGESGETADDASIGAEVAQRWDVEDKETWRTTARDWYTMGITEKPGEGRLHHHLALLARDVPGHEARALHHFTKSLVVTHDFATSRESILPLFDSALQSQRKLPDAGAMDLFIRLHGMLFTRIELDGYDAVMGRLTERLEEDGDVEGMGKSGNIGQVAWMTMCAVNIAAVLQYGSSSGVLRKALAQESADRRKAQTSAVPEEDGEILPENEDDDTGPGSGGDDLAAIANPDNWPITLTYAFQLAFETFEQTLRHPFKHQGAYRILNPYLTLFITFIATTLRQPYSASIMLPLVPWAVLVDFVNANLTNIELKEESKLVSGAPLPEDWAVRGMEWVGRRVYERGFWKTKGSGRGSGGLVQPTPKSAGERFSSEMDVLLAQFDAGLDLLEGVIDEIEGPEAVDGPAAIGARRWKRVAWAAGVMLRHVDGLELQDGKLSVQGKLGAIVQEEQRKKVEREEREREDERRRLERLRMAWAQEAQEHLEQLDQGAGAGLESDEEGDDLARLREKREQLQHMLAQAQSRSSAIDAPTSGRPARKDRTGPSSSTPQLVPGYTMLVFDTNVLVSHLSIFTALVESGAWTIIVPLPVVTELDGLSKERSETSGSQARAALSYLQDNLRKYSTQLKVQTTKGNYLAYLNVRTETRDNSTGAHGGARGRGGSANMDERILGVAEFQRDQWVDRSILLKPYNASMAAQQTALALEPAKQRERAKVVLVTMDRNLRLRAMGRGVEAVGEKEIQAVV